MEGNPSIEDANFHLMLDREMKRLSAKGLGGTVKKAECITVETVVVKRGFGRPLTEGTNQHHFLHEWIVLRFEIWQRASPIAP